MEDEKNKMVAPTNLNTNTVDDEKMRRGPPSDDEQHVMGVHDQCPRAHLNTNTMEDGKNKTAAPTNLNTNTMDDEKMRRGPPSDDEKM